MLTEIHTNSQTRTEQTLKVMQVLAWIAFIGLMVQAGALLVSYTISFFNPEAARNLYKGLDFYHVSQSNFRLYTYAISFMIALPAMKAYICFLVIKILAAVNLKNPFTTDVTSHITTISHVLLGIWIVAVLHNETTRWIMKRTGESYTEIDSGEFLFMAGLVFIISQVFKRGLEIQSENELTI